MTSTERRGRRFGMMPLPSIYPRRTPVVIDTENLASMVAPQSQQRRKALTWRASVFQRN